MENRRSFLKKASLLAGATATFQLLPSSIQRALAIEAPEGSSFLDAEHIVFLMQENRSFDHCFGTLRGVRGFNDPRAIKQPNGLPVWLQKNKAGEIYAPFRLDIENSKTTWMGSLPHSWRDMVYARNAGKMDTWLEAKKAGNADFRHMPLTMGYHNRQDIPFYYALADAFTVCDQHFCSSLTGTSANRSYFWSGTIREEAHNAASTAHVDNGQINYQDVRWTTYPERLQEAGISWKVYQNELSIPVGFEGEEEDWLANFTDNNLEFHKQYNVRFHPAHYRYMQKRLLEVEHLLRTARFSDSKEHRKVQEEAEQLRKDIVRFSPEEFNKLNNLSKEIHRRAFVTNTSDPDYHQLETIRYSDADGEKEVEVPKGDIFYQFRQDVKTGNLPTVSWLVAPCRFSDHPGSPWYGAWYVSEAMDILTADPEVWKKTIFILTYDENDGYFDHIPPFVPPHTGRPESGAVAQGIHTEEEYVTVDQERIRSGNSESTLDSPIGLGFRVPLVVASPWSKGGRVNSEVFDLTSPIQFMEYFLEKKFRKKVKEENISDWRRLICGNMTSIFQPIDKQEKVNLVPVDRDAYVERIYSAKDKGFPSGFIAINPADMTNNDYSTHWSSPQEVGTKDACALPYDLAVNAFIDEKNQQLTVRFEVKGKLPKTKTIGVPFMVMAAVPFGDEQTSGRTWNFAIREGEMLAYSWPLSAFGGDFYHLTLHGPNGFYRSFKGGKTGEVASIEVLQLEQELALTVEVKENRKEIMIKDLSYGQQTQASQAKRLKKRIVLEESHGWYDLEITDSTDPYFSYQYAGHLENGKTSRTDPLMGKA
ncbi:phosphocholine-specific phospholipase C [Sphingobacterium sp. LRF_L2]|uniref:phosphocholine-specific phospholipase C n=1 Tax=Sphingobacterium sp. LRF_L2 TaxID=3369421 RepID=UPI003F5D9C15